MKLNVNSKFFKNLKIDFLEKISLIKEVKDAKIRKYGDRAFNLKLRLENKSIHGSEFETLITFTEYEKNDLLNMRLDFDLGEDYPEVFKTIHKELFEVLLKELDYKLIIVASSSYSRSQFVKMDDFLTKNNYTSFKNMNEFFNLNIEFASSTNDYLKDLTGEIYKKYEFIDKILNYVENSIKERNITSVFRGRKYDSEYSNRVSKYKDSFYYNGIESTFDYKVFSKKGEIIVEITTLNEQVKNFEEFKALFDDYLDTIDKQRRIKNILTPLRTHYDKRMDSIFVKEVYNAIYLKLLGYYKPEEIEQNFVDIDIKRKSIGINSNIVNDKNFIQHLKILDLYFIIYSVDGQLSVLEFKDEEAFKAKILSAYDEISNNFKENLEKALAASI